MKKLFLASAFSGVAEIFGQIAGDVNGKTVTFIPTASNVEKVIFYVKSAKKAFEKLGMTVDELDIETASDAEIYEKLSKNDFIYLSGGNTFFLLQELRRRGADRIIAEQVSGGKMYIGESAGAMIASPDIKYAAEMDSVKKAPLLEGYKALGLADFYTVPHYESAPFKKAAQKIIDNYGAQLKLQPITNSQAVFVSGDEVQVY